MGVDIGAEAAAFVMAPRSPLRDLEDVVLNEECGWCGNFLTNIRAVVNDWSRRVEIEATCHGETRKKTISAYELGRGMGRPGFYSADIRLFPFALFAGRHFERAWGEVKYAAMLRVLGLYP